LRNNYESESESSIYPDTDSEEIFTDDEEDEDDKKK